MGDLQLKQECTLIKFEFSNNHACLPFNEEKIKPFEKKIKGNANLTIFLNKIKKNDLVLNQVIR